MVQYVSYYRRAMDADGRLVAGGGRAGRGAGGA